MGKIKDIPAEAVKEIKVSFFRTDTGQRELRSNLIAVEKPLHLIVNREHYVTILSTPIQRRELAVGHLVTEGIVKDLDEIKEIRIKAEKCYITLRSDVKTKERLTATTPFQRIISSECSTPNEWPFYKLIDRLKIPKSTSKICIEAKVIVEAAKQFSKEAIIHFKTGGVHAAALHKPNGETISFAEDVGRHNSIDKVIGAALIKNYNIEESFLTSTGRISGDIVLKAVRIKIPIVASLATALNSGVEIARQTNLTLLGFVRGTRMTIYTHPKRII